MLKYFREEPVLKSGALFNKDPDFPKTVILSWQDKFEKKLIDNYSPAEYLQKLCVGGLYVRIFIFETEKAIFCDDKDHSKNESENNMESLKLAFALLPLGGPTVSMVMEELSAIGARNFVFLGSAGNLIDDNDALIVPEKALRDEGTSYHYIDSLDDFIKVETADFTASFLEEAKIPFRKGNTWTTDCFYRETKSAIGLVKEKGCICVEMECASIMAVAKSKNLNAYQLLFTADKLSSEDWDIGRLKNMSEDTHGVYLEIIIALAKRVDEQHKNKHS